MASGCFPLWCKVSLDKVYVPLHMCWVHDGETRGIGIRFTGARQQESPDGSWKFYIHTVVSHTHTSGNAGRIKKRDTGNRLWKIGFTMARPQELPFGSLGWDNKNRQIVHGRFTSIHMSHAYFQSFTPIQFRCYTHTHNHTHTHPAGAGSTLARQEEKKSGHKRRANGQNNAGGEGNKRTSGTNLHGERTWTEQSTAETPQHIKEGTDQWGTKILFGIRSQNARSYVIPSKGP